MTGEQLNKKLKDSGYVLADVARLLNVPPQSLNQTLNAKDIKTGFLENLCQALNKDMSFFFDVPDKPRQADSRYEELADVIDTLRAENKRLRDELDMKDDPTQPNKESEVYRLWMEHMRLTEIQMKLMDRMRELYQNKEG